METSEIHRRGKSINGFAVYYLFMFLTMALAFLIGFYKIYNYDIWWHLKTGELILTDGIPETDPFSFTSAGNPWITHEWLAQVIFYLIYRLGGLKLLILIKGIATAATALILFNFARCKNIYAPVAAAVVMLAIAGLSFRIFARPHLFTFIFLSLLITILFLDSGSGKSFIRRRWLVIPAIMLSWVNMQAGFFIGLGIYWIVVLREILINFEYKSTLKQRLKKYALPGLFATLICFINPNGYKMFTYPVHVAGNPLFKTTISEWVSPLYLGPEEWLAKIILGAMLLFGLVAAILNIRKRPDISLIVLVAGAASIWAMRNVADYMIIAAAGIFSIPALPRLKQIPFYKIARFGIPLLASIWSIMLFGLVRGYQADNGRLGLEIKEGFIPEGSVKYLKETGFKGNIVNILQDGGYLIFHGYPDWKVFVDGRLLVYGQGQINNYRLVADGRPGAMELLDELNASAAVLPMPPKMGKLRTLLSADERWALVYFDDYYIVYLKNNLSNAEIIERFEYEVIDPLKSGYASRAEFDNKHFLEEARRGYIIDSSSALVNSVLAYAHELNLNFAEAADFYKKAAVINPLLNDNMYRAGNMYARIEMFDSALVWYGKAVNANPRNPQYQYFLGLTYYVLEDFDKARYHLEISNNLYPQGPARNILENLNNPK